MTAQCLPEWLHIMKTPRIALLSAGLLVLASCRTDVLTDIDPNLSVTPAKIPITVDNVARNSTDRRLAQKQHGPIIASFGGEYSNAKAERMVARIVGRLIEVSEDRSQVYQITLLDTPAVNAFALPGGYLYVTRGLLALANDSAELAGVIAHEMAHVELNHGIKRQQRQEEEELATRVVNDVLSDNRDARSSLVRGKIRFAQFTRNQELEADKIGIELLGKAGFDAYAASRFQKSMARYLGLNRATGGKATPLDFLASHPTAPQRAEFALRHARQFGARGSGDIERDRFLAGITDLKYGDKTEQGFIRGRKFLHADLGISFTAPRGYTLSNTKQAVLASGPNDAALRFDSVDVPQNTDLDVYLKSGWVNGLDFASVRQETINGMVVAYGSAREKGWSFDISLFRVGAETFRMLTAMPDGATQNLMRDAAFVRKNFRQISDAEKANLKPLRIEIKTVGSNTSVSAFSRPMAEFTADPEGLFRVLNGLSTTATLSRGQKVKIVTD